MAGEAAGESILFIAAITAAAIVAGTLGGVTTKYVNDLRDRSDQLEQEMAGRIAIVNDPARVPNNPVILYVKNTGTLTQDLGDFALFVDGVVRTTWTVTVNGAAATELSPGDMAAFSITGLNLAAGSHTASVVSDTNYADRMQFTV